MECDRQTTKVLCFRTQASLPVKKGVLPPLLSFACAPEITRSLSFSLSYHIVFTLKYKAAKDHSCCELDTKKTKTM